MMPTSPLRGAHPLSGPRTGGNAPSAPPPCAPAARSVSARLTCRPGMNTLGHVHPMSRSESPVSGLRVALAGEEGLLANVDGFRTRVAPGEGPEGVVLAPEQDGGARGGAGGDEGAPVLHGVREAAEAVLFVSQLAVRVSQRPEPVQQPVRRAVAHLRKRGDFRSTGVTRGAQPFEQPVRCEVSQPRQRGGARGGAGGTRGSQGDYKGVTRRSQPSPSCTFDH
eukprot:1179041-Prorocentrum_minimum.AAC.5